MPNDTYHHGNLKEELITAGLRLIARDGIKEFSLRKVAAACGVSHSAPYKHFQNRDEMLSAIADYVEQGFFFQLQDALSQAGDDPLTRLLELGKAYVVFMTGHPDSFQFLFFHQNTAVLSVGQIQSGISPCSHFSLFQQTATDYLNTTGERPSEFPYHILSMWSLVHGLSVIIMQGNLDLDPEEMPNLVERILRSACNAFCTAAGSECVSAPDSF